MIGGWVRSIDGMAMNVFLPSPPPPPSCPAHHHTHTHAHTHTHNEGVLRRTSFALNHGACSMCGGRAHKPSRAKSAPPWPLAAVACMAACGCWLGTACCKLAGWRFGRLRYVRPSTPLLFQVGGRPAHRSFCAHGGCACACSVCVPVLALSIWRHLLHSLGQ